MSPVSQAAQRFVAVRFDSGRLFCSRGCFSPQELRSASAGCDQAREGRLKAGQIRLRVPSFQSHVRTAQERSPLGVRSGPEQRRRHARKTSTCHEAHPAISGPAMHEDSRSQSWIAVEPPSIGRITPSGEGLSWPFLSGDKKKHCRGNAVQAESVSALRRVRFHCSENARCHCPCSSAAGTPSTVTTTWWIVPVKRKGAW